MKASKPFPFLVFESSDSREPLAGFKSEWAAANYARLVVGHARRAEGHADSQQGEDGVRADERRKMLRAMRAEQQVLIDRHAGFFPVESDALAHRAADEVLMSDRWLEELPQTDTDSPHGEECAQEAKAEEKQPNCKVIVEGLRGLVPGDTIILNGKDCRVIIEVTE